MVYQVQEGCRAPALRVLRQRYREDAELPDRRPAAEENSDPMKLELTAQQRQNLRAFCFPAVTQHHAGMPRRERRSLARAIAAGTWKELRA